MSRVAGHKDSAFLGEQAGQPKWARTTEARGVREPRTAFEPYRNLQNTSRPPGLMTASF
jgi:hypothetical protein